MQAKRVRYAMRKILLLQLCKALTICPRNSPIAIRVLPGTPLLLCDPVLAKQALANVIHNAILYCGHPNPVEIEARPVAHMTWKLQYMITARITKRPPEKVLEKFYKLRPTRAGGVGLGLSIAKGLWKHNMDTYTRES